MKKRILSMLVLLMTAVTGAWADTTVTWEGTTLQGIAVCKGYNYGVTTESMTVDGITITANDGFLLNDQLGVMLMSGAANGVVFSAENNIKSITITSTGFSKFTPDGSFQMSGGSHTYEVSPAATSYGFANGVDITGITKIEITLEGAPAAAGYTVSMKEGTEDATSWTITPAEATTTGVAAGTEVKATYGGTKKVKSVKAVKKASAPAGPTTVTWDFTQLSGFAEVPYENGGVTLSGGAFLDFENNVLGCMGDECTFTAPEGKKFTSIVITASGGIEFYGTGWSGGTWSDPDGQTTINFLGGAEGISTIVFTLVTASAEPEPAEPTLADVFTDGAVVEVKFNTALYDEWYGVTGTYNAGTSTYSTTMSGSGGDPASVSMTKDGNNLVASATDYNTITITFNTTTNEYTVDATSNSSSDWVMISLKSITVNGVDITSTLTDATPAASTVTWDFSQLSGYTALSGEGYENGGVTLQGSGNLNFDDCNLQADGTCTFTAPSGKKFTSIVITVNPDAGYVDISGFNYDYWSGTATWSGSSPSVSLSEWNSADGITSIVFTLEDE